MLVLAGGAAGLERDTAAPTRDLPETFRALARAAETTGAIVVDGGTDAGVMRLMGRARAATGGRFPLVGVAAAGTVALPRGTVVPATGPGGGVPLEPHHSHFVLVPGDAWGDESPWLAAVATALAGAALSATVLVDGGEISRRDVGHSLAAGRPVVVVAGSGRPADELAVAAARPPRLQVVELAAGPEAVAGVVRSLLTAPAQR